MELQIARRYAVAASLEQAWAVLGDLPALAACMPGAQLGEALGNGRHRGLVKARVGPASLQFQGEIELLECDATARRLRLVGKGRDAGSAASLQLSAWLEADALDPSACCLVGEATVSVSGKLAQIGNRLLAPASDALLAQFAQNFSTASAAVAAERKAAPAAATELSALGLLGAMLRRWWQGLFGPPSS